ncbi:MAG: 4-hydroxy-3-methylbut-2-en-1-yl diphosphate synthase [Chlorobi bacterium]|nr:MAG: (E)-4-hydroxy-3-methylbut-2-enyl-diphosphate synthase [Bacteroidota bacterium]KXK36207.1 MAG: (E)-4-hydroxy-3-methylbut-2-enyl-diphosphate synthase [Chlorobi bacterium OLB6]MBL1161928.1 4-hydroxy-3-methylbut-2-en-1-yl diphosphate synthase [Chlorobiota bacterium]MBW7854450.1 (E)-4-hydroxy-3-methylbut-2-enyl-diphosphate synthase [Candidatus Kapabacteria bacterium]MCC6331989.1 (E)-4-hydroxy-3-methylbut-2-enyl-diphosphate synthase [Ignavibacteria bacterium]
MIASRRPTIQVPVGKTWIGSNYPILVQSMTTTNTMDTQGTINQAIRMIQAGCELVRITAPSQNEAKNLENIKKGLRERGFTTPLVADIHFTPNAAEIAARIVEKVRINPGNYADKKQFAVLEYTDASYQAELDKIRKRFVPLLKICKEYGTALRVGTNHGSLSDRIVNRYGDNPEGMVISALEFLTIAHDEGFHDIVVSMKSSNPIVMIQAYRLFVQRCAEMGLPAYPLHLGVTEAGDGPDGRIKSAIGIGTLLQEGLGDTIRVSLTEAPEAEMPVASKLAGHSGVVHNMSSFADSPTAVEYHKRNTCTVANLGSEHLPRVVADISECGISSPAELAAFGHTFNHATQTWTASDQPAEYFYVGNSPLPFHAPTHTRQWVDYDVWKSMEHRVFAAPVLTPDEFNSNQDLHPVLNVVRLSAGRISDILPCAYNRTVVLWLVAPADTYTRDMRSAQTWLTKHNCTLPIVVQRIPFDNEVDDNEIHLLYTATDIGSLFVDGFGNGIVINTPSDYTAASAEMSLAYGILQAARLRITKTEFISCPSCGRTQFDLMETTAQIRAATDHLKGVKIGIMGCIVNGPGEMADADYGYVGGGHDTITLYRGQEVVQRGIDTAHALDALIALLKEDGKWIERPQDGIA